METKSSKLVFDARISRKLLKMNGEIKYCPYCGTPLAQGCTCHKNFIVDIKRKRDTENESVMVFQNNESFQADYDELVSELKSED